MLTISLQSTISSSQPFFVHVPLGYPGLISRTPATIIMSTGYPYLGWCVPLLLSSKQQNLLKKISISILFGLYCTEKSSKFKIYLCSPLHNYFSRTPAPVENRWSTCWLCARKKKCAYYQFTEKTLSCVTNYSYIIDIYYAECIAYSYIIVMQNVAMCFSI
jgi:hypothetical protein